MDFFDVESHVWLSLPAAQHQVVDFFRTGPGALQHPALGYTLYHLHRERIESHKVSYGLGRLLLKNKKERHSPLNSS